MENRCLLLSMLHSELRCFLCTKEMSWGRYARKAEGCQGDDDQISVDVTENWRLDIFEDMNTKYKDDVCGSRYPADGNAPSTRTNRVCCDDLPGGC